MYYCNISKYWDKSHPTIVFLKHVNLSVSFCDTSCPAIVPQKLKMCIFDCKLCGTKLQVEWQTVLSDQTAL